MRAQTGHSTDGGIYEIVSPSGKRYIGSAAIFRSRWYQHKKELRDGTHHCPPLQRAWNKYGEADIVFRILEIIEEPTRAKLLEREQWWLDTLGPDYNVAKLAGSVFGLRWKVKAPRSPEHLAKLSAARRLRVISDETRAKMSQTSVERRLIAHLQSPEARAASLAASHARKGVSTGRTYTDEQRERIAAANKAARANWTPEQREAWRLKHVGQKRSAEAKAKMSAAKKGKPSTKRADPSRCAKGLHPWVEGQKKGCRECNRAAKSAWDAKRKREAPAAA